MIGLVTTCLRDYVHIFYGIDNVAKLSYLIVGPVIHFSLLSALPVNSSLGPWGMLCVSSGDPLPSLTDVWLCRFYHFVQLWSTSGPAACPSVTRHSSLETRYLLWFVRRGSICRLLGNRYVPGDMPTAPKMGLANVPSLLPAQAIIIRETVSFDMDASLFNQSRA